MCIGYNAYDATLDAYLDEEAWAALPPLPPRVLRGAGRPRCPTLEHAALSQPLSPPHTFWTVCSERGAGLVKLVSSVEGKLVQDVQMPDGLDSLVRWDPEPASAGDDVVSASGPM